MLAILLVFRKTRSGYSNYNRDSPFEYVPQCSLPQYLQIVTNPAQALINAESWAES
jgi:hypothetical protein